MMNKRTKIEWLVGIVATGAVMSSVSFGWTTEAQDLAEMAVVVPPGGRAAPPASPAQEPAPDPAQEPARAEPACRVASGEPRLLSVSATCADCAPDAAVIEMIYDRIVDTETIAASVVLDPPGELSSRSGDCARRVLLGGSLAEQTRYTVTVGDQTASFDTAGGNPRTALPGPSAVLPAGGDLPILLSAVRNARLRVVPLRARDIAAAAQVAGIHRPGTDPIAQLPAALQRRVQERALDDSEGDEEGIQRVDPFAIASTEGPVFVVLEAAGVWARSSIVQRATHAVVLKVGRTSGLVWVVDTRSGTPAQNAQVSIYEGLSVRRRGRTDSSGLLRLPAAADLRRSEAPTPLRAVVEAGRHVTYVSENFNTGMEGWQLELPQSYGTSETTQLRGMVTAERGIYRPGETVHLLGMMRELAPDGRLRAPRGNVRVLVRDPDGNQMVEHTARLTAYGTFRQDVELPSGGRLGRYSVDVSRTGQRGSRARRSSRRGARITGSITSRFEVGEFRADTFSVTLPPAGAAERQNGDVIVPVSARYLYGAPVADATLEWTTSWRPRTITVPNAQGFTFRTRNDDTYVRYGTTGQVELDDAGEGTITIPESSLPDTVPYQAVDLIIEASVRDPSDDVVSASSVQHLSASAAWLGLRNGRWVVPSAAGWDLTAIAAAPDGSRVAGVPMEVRLIRRQWRSHAERGAAGVRYDGGWEEVEVASREVTSGAHPVQVHFDLPGGGEYRARLTGANGVVVAEARVYASGSGGTSPMRNHPRIDLIANQSGYAPGQTAEIYAQIPWERSIVLVTVEREGVLEARVERLTSAGTPLRVPILHEHTPNVFVGVAALPLARPGASSAAPVSGVPLRIGYRALAVSPEEQRLTVTVRPTEDDVRPGQNASVDVEVRDHRGRPVRAEVTLWAADEGVLALTGYQTPDPFAPVYADHAHAVTNAASVARWVHPDPDRWYDGGGDGDAGGEGSRALRSRFLSTAFFSRPVVTNTRGRARVRFVAPDNLTRWRVMAAVADRGDRFGRGEAALTTSQPLSAMPSLPRFLTQGDLVDAGVVVHNHTGAEGTAEVSLEIEGPAVLQGPVTQRVVVPEGGQVPVRFPIVARGAGELAVRARVRMGTETDGFEITLPVNPATEWASTHLGAGVVRGEASRGFRIPHDVDHRQVELRLTLSRSVLSSLEGGMDSLVSYPHGCVEQTTSKLIPMVLLEGLMSGSGSERFSGAEHRGRMDAAIAHVLIHQNTDGGFGLWPTSSSEGFLSAYALWGLMTARDHGYTVPPDRIRRGVDYLSENAQHGGDMHGQFSSQETGPFAAYVLAYAEESDDGLGVRLAGAQQQLSRFSVGLLANALTRRENAGATPLLDSFETGDGQNMIREGAGGSRGVMRFGSDLRATSSAVQAFVSAGQLDEASTLVEGIISDRRGDGTWGTTYNNMWALYAISTFATSQEDRSGPVAVEVRMNGRPIRTVRLLTANAVEEIIIPEASLPPNGTYGRLTLHAPSGRTLRYDARLRHVGSLASIGPRDRGFAVTRTLHDARTGGRVEHPEVGQLLRVRLIVRTGATRSQVAVVDRLPAGFEAVDTNLATRAGSFGDENDADGWTWREMHDDHVSFFANSMRSGTREAEYYVRASRSGEFIYPAPRVEAMYDPDVYGRGASARVIVRR